MRGRKTRRKGQREIWHQGVQTTSGRFRAPCDAADVNRPYLHPQIRCFAKATTIHSIARIKANKTACYRSQCGEHTTTTANEPPSPPTTMTAAANDTSSHRMHDLTILPDVVPKYQYFSPSSSSTSHISSHACVVPRYVWEGRTKEDTEKMQHLKRISINFVWTT